MTDPVEVAVWLAPRLEEGGLPYAFGGALAVAAWSAPRPTADVDVAVFVDLEVLPEVIDALERAGALVDHAEAAARVAGSGAFAAHLGAIRMDVSLATHPLHGEMRRRRRPIDVDGTLLWFLSPEDLAISKLLIARPKDVADLERLVACQPDLDVGYVEGWLGCIVAPGDRRYGILTDVVRRFGAPR